MIEQRKQEEISHYNHRKGKNPIIGYKKQQRVFLFESYQFLRKFLEDRCQGKKILDYGCGDGIHTIWLAKAGGNISGIDLSEASLKFARTTAEKEGVADKTEFFLKDCEKMDFPDSHFDIIFDAGTFSSIDFKKALPNLVRVLKPEGFLIGVETLGHNPLANLKRFLNKLIGKRTSWAAGHIFKIENFDLAKHYFGDIKSYYFHPISCLVFPLVNLPGAKFLIGLFQALDKIFLVFPFFQKISFKSVFIFSKPLKKNEKNI